MRKIFIITTSGDLHAEKLQEKFPDAVLNILTPTNFDDLSFSIDDSNYTFQYKDERFDFANTSIWYRKPHFAIYQDLVIDERSDEEILELKYATSSALKFYESLLLCSDKIFVLNRPDEDVRNKIYQLKVASEIGFKLPETLISNDKAALDKFLVEHNNCIIKSLNTQILFARKFLYFATNKISSKNLSQYPDMLSYPVLLQENVYKKNEFRITLVGNRIFACEMDTTNVREVDIRGEDYKTIPHKIVELPDDFKDKIFAYARHFNLNYGAFDFIQNDKDELVFLELNQNGQYYWIEEMTGAPLTRSIGELLLYPDKYKIV